jgi:glycosyltransferase involved in cell wall biosynthesis
MYDLGVPVIIGPLNGGLNYPESFKDLDGRLSYWSCSIGRFLSHAVNWFLKGKKEASTVLVANQRSKDALPGGLKGNVQLLVENGVDLSIWQIQKSLLDKHTPTFVFVGRLVDWKAVDIALEAFYKACEVHGKMILKIIGDGNQRLYLENIVSMHASSQGSVCFYGWQSQQNIAQVLATANALLLPSLLECGGAVVLEAMSAATAVIATKWGGPVDYLDENCGFLISPTSRSDMIDGFSNAMICLAANPELSLKMGLNGQRKVEKQFDWEKKVDTIVSIYNEQFKKS